MHRMHAEHNRLLPTPNLSPAANDILSATLALLKVCKYLYIGGKALQDDWSLK